MEKVGKRNCIMCGMTLNGNQKKFCSAKCRQDWHNSRVKSVRDQGAEGERQKKQSGNMLHEVAVRAVTNGHSYGKEVLQEFLAVQSQEMAKNKVRLCAMIQQKQADQAV